MTRINVELSSRTIETRISMLREALLVWEALHAHRRFFFRRFEALAARLVTRGSGDRLGSAGGALTNVMNSRKTALRVTASGGVDPFSMCISIADISGSCSVSVKR